MISGLFSVNRTGVQRMWLNFPPVLELPARFNSLWSFAFHPSGCFVVDEGNTLYVKVYNTFGAATTYEIGLLGFEEVI